MKKSRRRFLRAVAAGAAAAVVAPAARLAHAAAPAKREPKRAARRAPAARPAPSTGLAAEIVKQKASLAQTLKTIRDVPLDNGAEQAFVFRPLRPDGGR